MSPYEKTVYPRLAEPISADELVLDFTPTEEAIAVLHHKVPVSPRLV